MPGKELNVQVCDATEAQLCATAGVIILLNPFVHSFAIERDATAFHQVIVPVQVELSFLVDDLLRRRLGCSGEMAQQASTSHGRPYLGLPEDMICLGKLFGDRASHERIGRSG